MRGMVMVYDDGDVRLVLVHVLLLFGLHEEFTAKKSSGVHACLLLSYNVSGYSERASMATI